MKKHAQNDAEPHVFDQTNGQVDLGSEPAPQAPEEQRLQSRRLTSVAAQVMAYGQRHS